MVLPKNMVKFSKISHFFFFHKNMCFQFSVLMSHKDRETQKNLRFPFSVFRFWCPTRTGHGFFGNYQKNTHTNPDLFFDSDFDPFFHQFCNLWNFMHTIEFYEQRQKFSYIGRHNWKSSADLQICIWKWYIRFIFNFYKIQFNNMSSRKQKFCPQI